MIVSKTAPGTDVELDPEPVQGPQPGGRFDAIWANRAIRHLRGELYQTVAILFCVFLGLSLIINNELAGEASWFWYARLLHSGSRLYADLHMALQPLMVLEMDAWMQVFGINCLEYQIPAVIHLLILCLGLYLLLRESDWPDWQKAIVIAGSFVFWVTGSSYRFDDYHVTTESFVLYSMLLLLLMAKTDNIRRQVALAVSLGILCGFTVTSRINDGAALFVAVSICLPLLARKRIAMVTGLFVAVSLLTWFAVVRCTGDSFSVYLASTLTKAVASKGGAGTILSNPFHLFKNAAFLRHGIRWLLRAVIALIVLGALVQRFWKKSPFVIFAVQMVVAPAAFALSATVDQQVIPEDAIMALALCSIVVATYVLSVVVLVRFAMWIFNSGRSSWDPREMLILFPLGQLASNSSSAAGDPHSGYYAPMVLFLLLLPLLQPFRKQLLPANGMLLTVLLWATVVGTIHKWDVPYYWNSLRGRPMFVDREWYHHPVYGPMYVQTDLLQFSRSVCSDIGGIGDHSELLSLPFSYPNYFCDTPPWHGYVQTFIDITATSTMDKLLAELQTAPPRWIVYDRQIGSLRVQEKAFNHDRPSKQRELDRLIMQRTTSGQWQVTEFKRFHFGDDWYLIRTHP